ncbi:hypothetical protein BDD12DRAFT_808816 [Trichophaea hybrida]|nr:hypothetical protein BDD12DRAFT_808816 [Trichophaea hybrida]
MNAIRIFAFLSLTRILVYAIPIANATYKVEPAFVSEPTQRGTIGILWSCVSSFGLCVWTAVHPNIMHKQKIDDRMHIPKDRGRNMYKAMYMLAAILVPEFVVAIAFNEWKEAKKIQWNLKQHNKDKLEIKLKWCFFVVMGGISAEIGDETKVIMPEKFVQYVKDGVIKEEIFHKETLADKGQASNIAKLLVYAQITWLLIEISARKVVGLPITLLEVHVVIQIMMALVMYRFWWNKPLDVREPITFKLQCTVHIRDNTPNQPHSNNEMCELSKLKSTNNNHPRRSLKSQAQAKQVKWRTQGHTYAQEIKQSVQEFPGWRVYYSDRDKTCNLLLSGDIKSRAEPKTKDNASNTIIMSIRKFFQDPSIKAGQRKFFIDMFESWGDKRNRSMKTLSGLVGIFNGACHIVAWNAHFPTLQERWLWRVSSLAVVWSVMLISITGRIKSMNIHVACIFGPACLAGVVYISSFVWPEIAVGLSNDSTSPDGPGLGLDQSTQGNPTKSNEVKFRGHTKGNIPIDDPQQKHFISYLLAELLLIELRHIIKLEIIGEDGTPRVIFVECFLIEIDFNDSTSPNRIIFINFKCIWADSARVDWSKAVQASSVQVQKNWGLVRSRSKNYSDWIGLDLDGPGPDWSIAGLVESLKRPHQPTHSNDSKHTYFTCDYQCHIKKAKEKETKHIHYRTTKPTTHISLDIRNDHMQKPPYQQLAEHTMKMRPHIINCESNNQCARSRSITYKSAEYHHQDPMHSKSLMQAHLHIHLHSTLLSVNQINSAGYLATLENAKCSISSPPSP